MWACPATLKVEKDAINEDVEHSVSTEEPPRKKKKREKTKEVNEAKELETQSNEKREEPLAMKKEKNLKESQVNIAEERNEAPQVNLVVESETQSNKELEKKRKRKKTLKESEENIAEESKETEEVNLAMEAETRSNKELEKKRKRKKTLKESEENIAEESKETEEVNLAVESETRSNKELEKKRKRKKTLKESEENIAEESKETEEVNLVVESETRSNKELERKRKRKKTLKESEENIAEESKETEEVNLAVESETRSNKELKKKKGKSKDKNRDSLEKKSLPNIKKKRTQGEKKEGPGIRKTALTVIDEKLLQQMKEFIPDIESREVMNMSKMIKYDMPRFKEFKQQGISLNIGRFTVKENERLRKNVKDFMALTAIDNPTKLFFTHRFKTEQENIKKLKVRHKFFERIAEGIPRSCYYIYARGRRMFDEKNYQGEFTAEELHALNKLHTLHGSNWKKISELTGRSAMSLQKRYTQIADNEGPWSKKEVQRLLRAVRDHVVSKIPGGADNYDSVRVTKEVLYKRLPLMKISKKVKTRSWTQCREKWMGILAMRMSFGTLLRQKKSLNVQIKLIKGIYEMDIDDVAHVNWEDLTALIGDLPPTYIQRKWHKMKVCCVPNWQKKSFGDIVDFMYKTILPQLEQTLASCKGSDETQHNENQESYLLSDIFQDIGDDDDSSEVNT
ncbi:transcription termination factor 1 isoform X1 [Ictalurus punctatus]|uniref:Transcription termination factor 1 isoform X1 n=1 Tax=Ictalurus punctatus TaxID=7998 RepID=A0A2D0PNI3_ICTPU|nr:transcription termination factor 1 isoform X1 [Ictalurus punctatus]